MLHYAAELLHPLHSACEHELQQRCTKSLTRRLTMSLPALGFTQIDVLVDGHTEDGELYGRSQWDAPDIDPIVFLLQPDEASGAWDGWRV